MSQYVLIRSSRFCLFLLSLPHTFSALFMVLLKEPGLLLKRRSAASVGGPSKWKAWKVACGLISCAIIGTHDFGDVEWIAKSLFTNQEVFVTLWEQFYWASLFAHSPESHIGLSYTVLKSHILRCGAAFLKKLHLLTGWYLHLPRSTKYNGPLSPVSSHNHKILFKIYKVTWYQVEWISGLIITIKSSRCTYLSFYCCF